MSDDPIKDWKDTQTLIELQQINDKLSQSNNDHEPVLGPISSLVYLAGIIICCIFLKWNIIVAFFWPIALAFHILLKIWPYIS